MLAPANPLFVPVIVSFVSIYTQCLQMELGLVLLPDTYRSNTDFYERYLSTNGCKYELLTIRIREQMQKLS